MGNIGSAEYYTRVKRAMWGDWGKELKAVTYEVDGQPRVATNPNEVREAVQQVWAKQF